MNNFRIWPPNVFKRQNSTPKLKVIMQFYIESENFMKKYWNLIEFYCFEQNQFRENRELRYGRFCSIFAKIDQIWCICPNIWLITQSFLSNLDENSYTSLGDHQLQDENLKSDKKWAWLSHGHRWASGGRNPLESSVTALQALVCWSIAISKSSFTK